MDNTNTAIDNANKTAADRANEAVGVSTSTLEATPVKLNLPQTTPVVPDLPIYSFTQTTPDEAARQAQLQRGQQGNMMNLDQIYANMADLGTRGEFTQKAEEAAGIPQLNTQLTEIENELMQKSLAFRRERERIQTAGGTKAQVDTILSEVGRKQSQELADLEVIRAARSNTLTNAQNLVNRKVELEFADKQAQVDALKFIYDENKEVLNKEDDRLFQRAIAREERGFEIAKQQYVQTETEKMRYVANAAQAGADNNTLKAIQGARTLDELYSLPGIQNYALSTAEKLEIQAKRQSIYSSAVSTRLALAEAGDADAIAELGFDPRKEKVEELDATTKRQMQEKVASSDVLLKLLKDYRAIINTEGYTNKIAGNADTLGKINSLRGQITDAYKEARTLGTLDTGVITLVENVIGESPTSYNPLKDITGRESKKLVASLDTVIETTEARKAQAQIKLGIDPLQEAQFDENDMAEIEAAFGMPTSTTVFSPANYFTQ